MSSRSRRVLRRSSSCSVRNLCRSSRAENSSSASGLIRPSWASARSALRSRFCCSSRTYGIGSGSTSRTSSGSTGRRRHQLVGTVVADERLEVEAELVERALLELLHPHPLLGAQHLVAVHGVGQLPSAPPRARGPCRASRRGRARGRTGPARPRTTLDRRGQRTLQPGQHHVHALADRVGGVRPHGSGARDVPWHGPAPVAPARPTCAGCRRGRAGRGRAPRRCATRAGPPSRLAAPAVRPRRDVDCSAVSGSSSGASAAAASRCSSSASPATSASRACSAAVIAASIRSASALDGPGQRTRADRAPRRPRPSWRRTRAAWPAPRRPGSAPPAARSRGR